MRNQRKTKRLHRMGHDKELTPTKQREKSGAETDEMILAEDAVETTVYTASAPDCCSGEEKLENMLGMLGANIRDEDVYHCEDEHQKMNM